MKVVVVNRHPNFTKWIISELEKRGVDKNLFEIVDILDASKKYFFVISPAKIECYSKYHVWVNFQLVDENKKPLDYKVRKKVLDEINSNYDVFLDWINNKSTFYVLKMEKRECYNGYSCDYLKSYRFVKTDVFLDLLATTIKECNKSIFEKIGLF